MRLIHPALKNRRGLTLVELMIVVAVIGILASIAGVSYIKYVKSAKIGKLKQYAMEVANAQEQYKSQNSSYMGNGDGTAITYDETASSPDKWKDLLGFTKEGLAAQNITVQTANGGSTDGCAAICEEANRSFGGMWYAVRVTQDLDPDDSANTTVVLHSELEQPIILNEGK
ncbi:prepilin-type N-terminal cleavage/methylation domain-containing protein [Persicimonas caeni]|uniref:Prepilin-type N-terminal cleavage/methylation domain-containing protein n=1 Tax=Persicimonas caeni TaxID=2292766 RepID=A0A4Y6PPL2_PERCE|nr:prepilin-type N-terminal cleavage/methylation domain-containing protein [Persicimonas caeni]QDG49937.1 prepilin-type N-terminal cleavage/methylation domain-containing protein [Persicimonas caeni]QED31158.1 prepilin-type N-terminal cleavage/methylation domain-containing protein [Persicimonas caeni]